MSNILKNELDCTCDDFLSEVYGVRTKPCTEAMKTLFASVLTRSSTLVKELSAPLRLVNYDFCARLNPYLLASAKPLVGAGFREAVPMYVKLAMGRHKKDELLYEAISAVMNTTDGKG